LGAKQGVEKVYMYHGITPLVLKGRNMTQSFERRSTGSSKRTAISRRDGPANANSEAPAAVAVFRSNSFCSAYRSDAEFRTAFLGLLEAPGGGLVEEDSLVLDGDVEYTFQPPNRFEEWNLPRPCVLGHAHQRLGCTTCSSSSRS
jgi:hypothetical protein